MPFARRSLISLAASLPFLAGSVRAQPPADERLEPTEAARSNAAAARRFFEALSRGDLSAVGAFIAPDMQNHGRPVGRAGLLRVLTELKTMFPDFRQDVIGIASVGDTVICRTEASGTHRGKGTIPVEGGMLVGIEPTGKSFKALHIHWWRFRDGLIAEHFATRDDVSMMQQLGLMPGRPG